MNRTGSVAIAVASAVAVSGSVFALAFRPRMRGLGATGATMGSAQPGVEHEAPRRHRPILSRETGVDTPPDEVWPWLI